MSLVAHVPEIERLQAAMSKMPQMDVETVHYFSDGMYIRWVNQPKDSLVVGKRHKKDHFFMLAKGRMAITDDSNKPQEYDAPALIVSKAGAKRALLALEDSAYFTVHRTFETDLDCIEAECIEPDDTSIFDSTNKPKIDVKAFRELTKRVIAGEKPGFWSDWTPEQQRLYTAGDWRGFSKSRGYSGDEISDYSEWMKMIAQALNKGLNPFVCISDLATEAAIRNIALDKKGEILLSSHLPFEQRREVA